MSERRTSGAKEYMPVDNSSQLETYGVARNHFEHARDPMISQQITDLAREQAVEEARAQRGGILANGGQRLPEYHPPAQQTQPDDRTQSGSQMVKEDQPQHNLRPPEEFARSVDREAFDLKWYQERAAAREQLNEREQPEITKDDQPQRSSSDSATANDRDDLNLKWYEERAAAREQMAEREQDREADREP